MKYFFLTTLILVSFHSYSQGHIDSLLKEGIYYFEYSTSGKEYVKFCRFLEDNNIVIGDIELTDSIKMSKIGNHANTYNGLQRKYNKFYSNDTVVIWKFNQPEHLLVLKEKNKIEISKIINKTGRNFEVEKSKDLIFIDVKFESNLDQGDVEVHLHPSKKACFSSCENLINEPLKFICSNLNLYKYLYDFEVEAAIEEEKMNFEQLLRVEFIVEKDGSLSSIEYTGNVEKVFLNNVKNKIDSISAHKLFAPANNWGEIKRSFYSLNLIWRKDLYNEEFLQSSNFGDREEFHFEKFEGKIYLNDEKVSAKYLEDKELDCFSMSFKYKDWIWDLSTEKLPRFYFDCYEK